MGGRIDGFTAAWLALREPADAAARALGVTRFAAELLASRDVVRAVDLATGTGANVRYLSAHLPAQQRWLLADRDEALLLELPQSMLREPCVGDEIQVESRCMDLSTLDDGSLFADRDLVTTSALLDLVSDDWLASLVTHCHRVRAQVLFALTYNGRIDFSPGDTDDERVRDLVNRHQRTDKGFGPALGPDASRCAEEQLQALGYHTRRETSDWVLGPTQSDLQRQLIDGWARAAREMDAAAVDRIEGWKTRRTASVLAGRSALVVGHEDVAGVLAPRP
jgi:hypothetical protein